MKNIRILSTLLCAMMLGLFIYSCGGIDYPPGPVEKPYLTVQRNTYSIAAEGGVLYATASSNGNISAQPKADWCKVNVLTDTDSNNIVITIEENGNEARNVTIVLSAPGCKNVEIVVSQKKISGPDDEKSETCDLLSFTINGSANKLYSNISFSLDQVSKTAKAKYLKWIKRDEPDMMIPVFTTNGEKVLVNGLEVESSVTKISFAEDFDLVVVAENGDTKTYKISLNCPQINKELPVLRFSASVSSIGKDYYQNSTLDMYSPSTTSGWWSAADAYVQIRGRGNSTWGAEKKPYRIKFPADISPIGLNHAEEKDWVILAQDMDKSLLRNHMAFEMSRILFNSNEGYHDPNAIMWTPCSQHVNVYFGDDYHGIYQMSDHKERGEGRMNVEKLTATDTDTDTNTGGYLLESDVHGDSPRFGTNAGMSMHMYYPKDDDYNSSQLTYIKNHLNSAEAVLFGNNYADPVNGWRKYFDEKTMIDFMIIKEFTGDYDGFTSTQIYKRRGNNKIFFGPVWDVDKGWGNERRKDAYSGNGKLIIYEGFFYAQWFQRLWEKDATFRANVKTRWNAKKQELYNVVMKELDEKPVEMAKAIEANFSVWTYYKQTISDAPLPAATYQLEIERIRSLTQTRFAQLDNLFK